MNNLPFKSKLESDHERYYFILGKTLFVRTPKCGSSSLIASFNLLNLVAELNNRPRDGWGPNSPAVPLSEALESAAHITTAIVITRNPFDRLVSCYRDRICHRGASFPINELKRFKSSFLGFAEAISELPEEKSDQHFRSQFTFLQGIPKNINLISNDLYTMQDRWDEIKEAVDLTCYSEEKQEHIKKQFSNQFRNDKVSLLLPMHKKKLDYRRYYTDKEVLQMVEQRYHLDLERFGYEF